MLVFLVVLFALPLIVVLAMHQLDYRPGGKSYGTLITPPRALQLPAMQDLQGNPFTMEQWKKKWTMAYVAHAECDSACEQKVHLLRQIHVTLNKEIERVQRVLIVADANDNAALAALQSRYPDLVVLTGNEAAVLAKQFDQAARPAIGSAHAFVVDPLGNVILSYPEDFDAKGMQKDITRLLKYSWVG